MLKHQNSIPKKIQIKSREKPIFNPDGEPQNKTKQNNLLPNYIPKNKIKKPDYTPNITPQSNPRTVYSEKNVRYWINQYQQYNNFKKVQNHFRDESKKVPAISTLKSRIKELIGQEKYKELMKKYSFDDLNKIVSQAGISKTGVPGKILSSPKEFKGVKSKLLYECEK